MKRLPILGYKGDLPRHLEIHSLKKSSHSRENFARIYPAHLVAFSKFLICLRDAVGGDLELALILAVIGERHFAHRRDPDTPTYESIGLTETTPGDRINTLSLAQYTGIPRETARRKVGHLIDLGWVTVDERGNLVPTAQAAKDLQGGTDAAIAFLDHIIEASDPASE